MQVTLYSTGCPKCNVLKKKLSIANIQYTEITDIDQIFQICKSIGIENVPILVVEDGHILDFARAIDWIKKVGEDNA